MTVATQEDKDLVCSILGYRDWDEATDYRTTGNQDRIRDEMLAKVVAYRMKIYESCDYPFCGVSHPM